MQPTKDQLDIIYEALADRLHSDDLLSKFILKSSSRDVKFCYMRNICKVSELYYLLEEGQKLVKVTKLSEVSCEEDLLKKVFTDARDLVEKAREERKVLDFYLERIRNL